MILSDHNEKWILKVIKKDLLRIVVELQRHMKTHMGKSNQKKISFINSRNKRSMFQVCKRICL